MNLTEKLLQARALIDEILTELPEEDAQPVFTERDREFLRAQRAVLRQEQAATAPNSSQLNPGVVTNEPGHPMGHVDGICACLNM